MVVDLEVKRAKLDSKQHVKSLSIERDSPFVEIPGRLDRLRGYLVEFGEIGVAGTEERE